jgi:ech hydrogenase subunit F
MSLFSFTKTELKNLFSKPATRLYPQQPREYTARTRGHIENDIDACILCGLCSRKCPTGAIKVDRAGRTWSISRFSCIQCGYCVENCPKKSLSMNQSYTQPGAEKTTDVQVKPESPAAAAPKAAAPAAKPAPAATTKPAPAAAAPKAAAPAAKPADDMPKQA